MKSPSARTGLILLAAWLLAGATPVGAAAAAPAPGPDKNAPKVSVDGKEVETVVPVAVRGRNVLIPGDLAVKLGVSIKWNKKTITVAHGDTVAVMPIDGGKKGGELHKLDRKTEVPLIPARILREAFNLNIAQWQRGEDAVVVDTKEPFNPYKEELEVPKMARVGSLVPDFSLSDLEGKPVSITSFAGKRLAIFVFASWDTSRDLLGKWQEFVDSQEDESVQLIGVAMEAEGTKWVSKYAKRGKVKFPILIDSSNHLSRLFGFQSVPMMITLDELQVYQRLLTLQGMGAGKKAISKLQDEPFRPEYLAPRASKKPLTIREVIKAVSEDPGDVGMRMLLCEIYRAKGDLEKAVKNVESAVRADPDSAEALFRWGLYLWESDKKDDAIKRWREAAVKGPDEWIIRTQIWALEEPARFYKGKIDLAWQQLKRQRGE